MPTRAPVLSRLTAFERQAVCLWWRPLSVKLQGRIDLDEDLTMLIGPGADGRLLEIGVLDLESDDPVVIHAMELRRKFYLFLR